MKIKISKKLLLSISAVIVGVFIFSIFINTFLVDKYYIYEKRKVLDGINETIKSMNSASEIINNIPNAHKTKII